MSSNQTYHTHNYTLSLFLWSSHTQSLDWCTASCLLMARPNLTNKLVSYVTKLVSTNTECLICIKNIKMTMRVWSECEDSMNIQSLFQICIWKCYKDYKMQRFWSWRRICKGPNDFYDHINDAVVHILQKNLRTDQLATNISTVGLAMNPSKTELVVKRCEVTLGSF